jgi:hypothetical protein
MENNVYNMWNNSDIAEIFPNMFISNYSTSTNKTLLQNLGITHIITINSFFNPPYPADFIYHYFPAYDDSNEDISPFFDQFAYMARGILLDNKNKILIHCQAGRSRSASLVLAFIIRYLTDAEFQWQINHELIHFYIFSASTYLLRYDPLIQKNEPNQDDNARNLISCILNLMKLIRPVIRPNDRFLEQLKDWYNSSNRMLFSIVWK